MEKLKFEFTKEVAQRILDALVKEPYVEVAPIIEDLNKQAAEQLNKQPEIKPKK